MATIKQELPNGPLSVVLFQMQYAPILNIDTYIPAIQDYCRKVGFPQTSKMRGDMMQIGQNGEVEKTVVLQWVFASADFQKTLFIDTEKLTFQVFDLSNYSFEDLLDTFMQLMNKIDALVEFSLINRLGLRFINTIEEKPELTWQCAIKPEFQGCPFPDDVHWADKGLMSWALQKRVKLSELKMTSNFLVRIYQNAVGRKYPEDIIRDPRGVIDFVSSGSLVTYVDLDHFIVFQNGEKEVLMPKGKEVFVALHTVIENVFFSSLITKEARQLWS
jgi:uncharacterized protein (TIGR04255 family)